MNTLKQAFEWVKTNRLAKHLLIYLTVIIGFALLYVTVGFYYGINDDMSMFAIASGGYNGVPDGHLIFISYILGGVIAKLFEILPGIDWYGGMMLFLLSFCAWLVYSRIVNLTSKMQKSAYLRVVSVLFVVSLTLMNVIFFQFTTVAGVLAATALFLIASEEEQGVRISRLILCAVLLTLSFVIREEVFMMAAPYVVIFIGVELTSAISKWSGKLTIHEVKNVLREHSRKITYYGCIIGFALLAVVAVEKINDSAYSSEEWSECKSFILCRSKIVDYNNFPPYDENKELWDMLEVSPEEHAIFYTSFGMMPDVEADTLHKIYEKADTKSISLQGLTERFFENVLHGGYSHYKLGLIVFFLIVFGVCVNKNVCLGEKLKIVGPIALAGAELFYLLLNGRFPNRVFFVWELAMVASVGGVILRLFVGTEDLVIEKKQNRLFKLLFLGAICLLLLNSIKITWSKYINYTNELEVYNEYNEYVETHDDRVFIEKNGTVENRKQFTVFRTNDDKINIISANGWYSSLPMVKEWKEEQGLDVKQFPLCQESVYYMTKDADYINLMDEYMKTLGWTSGYSVVDELQLPNGYVIYVVSWNE